MRIRGKILVRQLISCGMQTAQTARECRLTIFVKIQPITQTTVIECAA